MTQKELTEEQINECIEKYQNGETLMDIAIPLGFKSYRPIGNVLRNHGVKIRRNGHSSFRGKGFLPLDVDYFKEIDTEEKAYWLGFLFADGWINSKYNKVTLCVKDWEVVDKFKRAVGSGHKHIIRDVYDQRTKKHYRANQLIITSKHFAENLEKWGCDGNKSTEAHFPEIDEKYYSHFIRGLFEGDGSVFFMEANGRENVFTNLIATSDLLDFIINHLEKTINIKFKNPYNLTDSMIRVHLQRHNECLRFLEYIYKDSTEEIRLTRKYERFLKAKEIEVTREYQLVN